jgi:hypothetical protein
METRPIGRIVRLHAPIGRRQAAVDPPNGLHHWGQSGKPRDGQKFLDLHYQSHHRRLSS